METRKPFFYSKEKKAARKELIQQLKKEVSILEVAVNLFGLTPARQTKASRFVKVIEHSSFTFDIKRNVAYCNLSTGSKPLSVIDFIMQYDNCSGTEAINKAIRYYKNRDPKQMDIFLLNGNDLEIITELQLPRAFKNNDKLIDYLCNERYIDINLINKLIDDGQLYEDTYHNCIFVGFNYEGEKTFGFRRGTYVKPDGSSFRGDCTGSHKLTGYVIPGDNKKIVIVEAMIDGLSWLTLHPESNATVICSSGAGCAANTLWHNFATRIKNSEVEELIIAVDHDEAGDFAEKEILRLCEENQYKFNITKEAFDGKDLNSYLQSLKSQPKETELISQQEEIKIKDELEH